MEATQRILVYESNDLVFLHIIEQALKDNGIPCSVIGANVALGCVHITRIYVDQEFYEQAKIIVEKISD